jgi:hypothetical protein
VADLSGRQLRISTELDAPKEGQSRGRVSWLLRQLANAPADLTVEARVSRLSTTLSAPLGKVRDDPSVLMPDRTREIRAFRLTLTRDLGLNRSAGRGSFIDSIVLNVKAFYGDVLQKLVAWKPRAPKLRVAGPIENQEVDAPDALTDAIEGVASEADKAADVPAEFHAGPSTSLRSDDK